MKEINQIDPERSIKDLILQFYPTALSFMKLQKRLGTYGYYEKQRGGLTNELAEDCACDLLFLQYLAEQVYS